MTNREIASWLADYAELLEKGGEKLYRTKAYRRAAESVLFALRPVERIVSEEGRKGLQKRLPGVGAHLALTIERLVQTGQFRSFEEWRKGSCLPGSRTQKCPVWAWRTRSQGPGPTSTKQLTDAAGHS